MSTKNQSFTIDEEVLYKLGVYARTETISKSSAVNKILKRFLNVEVKISLADTPYEKPPVVVQKTMTEEERLEDWEWRKGMVNQGKFPTYMAEEYPRTIRDYTMEKDVYLTPDGKPSDTVEKLNARSQEDIDFDESVAMSLAEKE